MSKHSWERYAAVIIGIIFVFVVIKIFNQAAKNQKIAEQQAQSAQNAQQTNTVDYSEQSKTQYSGDTVPKQYQESLGVMIQEFYDYCLEKDYTQAYKMLSSDVKRIFYPTEQSFIENYCNTKFEGNKQFSFQSWIAGGGKYTYKVRIFENMLSSGKVNNEAIEDYVTPDASGDTVTLNINNYIGKKLIGKQAQNNNISITVPYVDTFMDYEIYTFRIKNNLDEALILDTRKDTQTTYLVDTKGHKKLASLYENIEEDLKLEPQESKEIQIKFNTQYKTDIKEITFTNIVKEAEYSANPDIKGDTLTIKLDN